MAREMSLLGRGRPGGLDVLAAGGGLSEDDGAPPDEDNAKPPGARTRAAGVSRGKAVRGGAVVRGGAASRKATADRKAAAQEKQALAEKLREFATSNAVTPTEVPRGKREAKGAPVAPPAGAKGQPPATEAPSPRTGRAQETTAETHERGSSKRRRAAGGKEKDGDDAETAGDDKEGDDAETSVRMKKRGFILLSEANVMVDETRNSLGKAMAAVMTDYKARLAEMEAAYEKKLTDKDAEHKTAMEARSAVHGNDAKLKAEIETLQRRLDASEKSEKATIARRQAADRKANAALAQVTSKDAEIKELKANVASLETAAEAAAASARAAAAAREADLTRQLNAATTATEADQTRFLAQLQEREATITQLQSSAASQKAAADAELASTRDAAARVAEDLRGKLNAANQATQEAQSAQNGVQIELGRHAAKIEELQRSVASHKEAAEAESAKARAAAANAEKVTDEAKTERELILGQLRAKDVRIASLEAELKAAQTALANAERATTGETPARLAEVTRERDETSRRLAAMITAHEKETVSLSAARKTAEDTAARLGRALEQAKARFTASQPLAASAEALGALLKSAQDEVARLTQELARAHTSSLANQSLATSAQSELERLRSLWETARADYERRLREAGATDAKKPEVAAAAVRAHGSLLLEPKDYANLRNNFQILQDAHKDYKFDATAIDRWPIDMKTFLDQLKATVAERDRLKASLASGDAVKGPDVAAAQKVLADHKWGLLDPESVSLLGTNYDILEKAYADVALRLPRLKMSSWPLAFKKILDELKTQAEGLHAEIATATAAAQAADDLRGRLSGAEANIANLSRENKRLSDFGEQREASLTTQINTARSRIKELQQKFKTANDRVKALNKEKKSERKLSEEQLAKARAEYERLIASRRGDVKDQESSTFSAADVRRMRDAALEFNARYNDLLPAADPAAWPLQMATAIDWFKADIGAKDRRIHALQSEDKKLKAAILDSQNLAHRLASLGMTLAKLVDTPPPTPTDVPAGAPAEAPYEPAVLEAYLQKCAEYLRDELRYANAQAATPITTIIGALGIYKRVQTNDKERTAALQEQLAKFRDAATVAAMGAGAGAAGARRPPTPPDNIKRRVWEHEGTLRIQKGYLSEFPATPQSLLVTFRAAMMDPCMGRAILASLQGRAGGFYTDVVDRVNTHGMSLTDALLSAWTETHSDGRDFMTAVAVVSANAIERATTVNDRPLLPSPSARTIGKLYAERGLQMWERMQLRGSHATSRNPMWWIKTRITETAEWVRAKEHIANVMDNAYMPHLSVCDNEAVLWALSPALFEAYENHLK